MKKAFCILTAIMLIFTALVFSASATGGTDGSVTWDYNPSSKVLTFSGSGAIPGYDQSDNRPWRDANGCKTLVIQSGVTGIGTNAFYTFNSLESVTIADSVKTIGRCAFQNCGELLTVSMGDGVTSIGSAAFSQCYKLTEVTGGANVTSIDSNAFYSCQTLKSFTLSDKLESIGNYAFENCYKLQTAAIPASVRTIGKRAFFKNNALETAEIPEGVTEIGEQTFFGCEGLKTVTIPASMTSIGNYAFNNCAALETVNYIGTESSWNSVSKGSCIFGWYDGEYKDRAAGEMPAMNFISSGVRLKVAATVSKQAVTNSGGTVTGSGTYEKGKQVVITATPSENYVFDGWYGIHAVDGKLTTVKYSNATQVITLNSDESLAALFVKATSSDFTVTITATEGGTASGGGIFHPGQTAQISAKAESGWHFAGWYDGETKLSSSANFAFDVTKNTTLTAKFEKDGQPEPEQPVEEPEEEPGCPWCGKTHTGFFGGIVNWFHGILAKIFGAKF